jgi:hypothetical protein
VVHRYLYALAVDRAEHLATAMTSRASMVRNTTLLDVADEVATTGRFPLG